MPPYKARSSVTDVNFIISSYMLHKSVYGLSVHLRTRQRSVADPSGHRAISRLVGTGHIRAPSVQAVCRRVCILTKPIAVYGESCMRRRPIGSMLFLVVLCSLCLAASDAVAQTVKLKGSGGEFSVSALWSLVQGLRQKCQQASASRLPGQREWFGGIKVFVYKTGVFCGGHISVRGGLA